MNKLNMIVLQECLQHLLINYQIHEVKIKKISSIYAFFPENAEDFLSIIFETLLVLWNKKK